MSGYSKAMAGLFAALCFFATSAYAQNGDWRIVETNGAVRLTNPAAGVQLVSLEQTVASGAILATGADGRAVLMRGDQKIVVGPNSRMSLPAAEKPGMTRVLQDLGTLLFKVDKRETHHFRVETPMIAAVVKGTTFTVTAGVDRHSVHVAEGAVEVSSLNGVARELVTAGRTARILRANPGVIQFIDTAPRGVDDETSGKGVTPVKKASLERPGDLTKPAAIGDEPLDFAALTDGLVQSSEMSGQAINSTDMSGRGASAAALAGAQSSVNAVSALRSSATGNSEVARLVGSGSANGGSGNTNVSVNAGSGGANVSVNNGNANVSVNAGSGGANVSVNAGNSGPGNSGPGTSNSNQGGNNQGGNNQGGNSQGENSQGENSQGENQQ